MFEKTIQKNRLFPMEQPVFFIQLIFKIQACAVGPPKFIGISGPFPFLST